MNSKESLEAKFQCETRLHQLDSDLHIRYKDSIVALNHMLNHYQAMFPNYTDHTVLHSMDVIEFCNQLIGDYVEELNADELYILLMSCYLHDTGMGISKSDFETLSENIDFKNFFDTHSKEYLPDVVRNFHHEFSGEFIKKYAPLFDIPSDDHVFSIVQVSRGHRKTDLYDETEYPSAMKIANGNELRLPYLAALIRLADELDVTIARNISFLYHPEELTNPISIGEFKKHEAVKALHVLNDSFELDVSTEDETVYQGVLELVGKMQETLDYCIDVVSKRTPFEIHQKKIVINRII